MKTITIKEFLRLLKAKDTSVTIFHKLPAVGKSFMCYVPKSYMRDALLASDFETVTVIVKTTGKFTLLALVL